MRCAAVNVRGEPCAAPDGAVDASGYCPAHRDGGRERMRAVSALGGQATVRAWQSPGFTLAELTRIESLEDAKRVLDDIRMAAMSRRLTHAEANAASKAVAEWVKAETAAQAARLVNELQRELDAKGREIEALRLQLHGRAVR